MNIEEVRDFCIQKKGVEETFPFDSDTLVFKIMDKVFLLTSLSEPFSINLKCDPERAIELREQYSEVLPGYHMNKKHWNTVMINGSLGNRLIFDLIEHSYNLVVQKLPKSVKSQLESGNL